MTSEMLELLDAVVDGQTPKHENERWLVAISGEDSSWMEACRSIYSQLPATAGFAKAFVAFNDGRVGTLNGRNDDELGVVR